jgi:hypothetical protein
MNGSVGAAARSAAVRAVPRSEWVSEKPAAKQTKPPAPRR